MQLNYQAYGAGPPVVILHGLFGSLENWQSVSRRLANQYRVFAVDQRNHGRSPHHEQMTYREMARDLEAFLDATGLDSVRLVGHSMGGKTAMQFSALYRHRVESLVVVDIAPGRYPPSHREILCALTNLRLSSYHTRQDMEEALSPQIPDITVRRFLLKNVERGPEGGWQWRMNLEAICRNYENLIGAIDQSGTFDGPVLFVRGGLSDYVNEEDLPWIRRMFPRAVLHTVPQAGHWVHAEALEKFCEVVMEFFQ